MKKVFLIVTIGLLPIMFYSQKKTIKKSKRKIHTKKTTSPNGLTRGQLTLIEFRQENPVYYKNHIEGLADSAGKTNIDYSNFNGKDCSEIAKKENWGEWSPPENADEKCSKYLKNKKLKKILLYPLK